LTDERPPQHLGDIEHQAGLLDLECTSSPVTESGIVSPLALCDKGIGAILLAWSDAAGRIIYAAKIVVVRSLWSE
jgi:hypothetical protein